MSQVYTSFSGPGSDEQGEFQCDQTFLFNPEFESQWFAFAQIEVAAR